MNEFSGPPVWRAFLWTTIAFVALSISSCSRGEYTIALTTEGPIEGPVEVRAYPIDPALVLDSLASAYGVPQPEFRELESRLLDYRHEFAPELQGISESWRATRDSVRAMAAELYEINRSSETYRRRYQQFREMYARLMARSSAREVAYRELTANDRELAAAAAEAADSLRMWEDSAYAGFEQVVSDFQQATGLAPVAGLIHADSTTVLPVSAGRWWVVAHARDIDNPFALLEWRVEARPRWWRSTSEVVLDSDSATSVWRY